MKKNLILSLLAVAVCSVAVYAEDIKLGDKIKTETETTSVTVQEKADSVDAVAGVTGNTVVKEKASKVSTKTKTTTKKTAVKVNTAVDKVATVKSDFATSTTTTVNTVVASTCATVVK